MKGKCTHKFCVSIAYEGTFWRETCEVCLKTRLVEINAVTRWEKRKPKVRKET